MSQISDVVIVTISIANVGITRAGFGTAMALAPVMTSPISRVDLYDQTDGPGLSAGDVVATNYLPVEQAYDAYFKPSPKPSSFAVGRIKMLYFALELGGLALSIGTYSFDLHWKYDDEAEESKTITYVSAYADAAAIIGGLAQAVKDDKDIPFTAGALTQDDDPVMLLIVRGTEGRTPLVAVETFVAAGDGKFTLLPYGAVVSFNGASVTPLTEYTITVNKTDCAFTTGAVTDVDELFEGWRDAINAATIDGVFAEFTPAHPIPGGDPAKFIVINESASCRLDIEFDDAIEDDFPYIRFYGETMAQAFDACRLASTAWYAYGLVDRSKIPQYLCAAKAETEITVFSYASSDTDAVDEDDGGDSVAASCSDMDFERTMGIYDPRGTGYYNEADATDDTNEQWLDFGIFASRLTVDLDTETATWKFASPNGFVVCALTPTQKARLIGDPMSGGDLGGLRMNFFDSVGGTSIFREGCVHSGEWIDIIVGRDWLTTRMQEDIYSALVASNKVPYTDDGIMVIVNQITMRLQIAQTVGFLAFDTDLDEALGFYLTYPKRADVAAATRSARLLTDIKWKATLAGAIHTVIVSGTVSA